MTNMKLNKMEDILSIPNNTESVIIDAQEVLRFLYKNSIKGDYILSSQINTSEVRKQYIDYLKDEYKKKENDINSYLTFTVDKIINNNVK